MTIDYTHPRRRAAAQQTATPAAAPRVPAESEPVVPEPLVSYTHPKRGRRRSEDPAPSPEPATTRREEPAREEPELNPELLLQSVLELEIRWRDRSAKLRADHERLRALVEQVLDMRGLEPSHLTVDRDLLARERIDTSELEDLLGRYRSAYGMTGQIRKATLRGRIDQAVAALLDGLKDRAERARALVVDAERQYADALAELGARRAEVDAFIARRPFLYDREHTYVGDVAARAAAGIQPYLLHSSWDLAPMDARWAHLPFAAVQGLTWLPGPGASYSAGCSAVRTQVLEQMANAFPRQLIVTWIDPVGRGASAGPLLELLEIDKNLLDNQVWVEPDEVERALRRITERMAYLEQRCLKSRFADLDEYNLQAGSLAEPRHVVAVTGYPRNFTDETRARLAQIQDNGPRLGITVHVVADESAHQPVTVQRHGYPAFHGVQFPGVTTPVGLGGHIVFSSSGRPHVMTWAECVQDQVWLPARFPEVDDKRARQIVEGYAHSAVEAGNVVVDSEAIIRPRSGGDTSGGTAREIVLPVGALGRGDRFDLRLGQGLAQNVLVGGLPGSGKSSLFHTIITAAVRHYTPEELELYLLDFKEGVEFQAYAAAELPHARVVAVQSERAFGLSVLRGLEKELTARAGRFKSVGASSIADFRDRTGESLPRVLVVVDEFQVLFAEEDATAFDCASLLESLIRQGRSYGVHTILGTQTMRGATQRLLGAALDLVAVRIALKTSESDSELFLAAGNRAASRLTRPGEAIFNPDGGAPEGNLTFQVALTADDTRHAVLDEARDRARGRGWTRKPLVFDGTRVVSVADDDQVTALLSGLNNPDPRAVRLHWGLPVALGGSGSVSLWRRGGAHALLVGRDQAATLGSLTVALLTAHASAPGISMTLVECLGVDEDHGMSLADVGALLPYTRCVRRRALAEVLAEFATEVRRRTADDDYGARRMLLVVNAVQRARDLDDVDAYEPTGPVGDLVTILRDGADVGVHALVTADSLATVHRRLGRNNLSHFGLRLVGPCSVDASDALIGSTAGALLGDAYMIVVDADEGRAEQVRPYPIPNDRWLRDAAASIHQIGSRR